MQTEPRLVNVLALAFLGDALYEVYVREHILDSDAAGRADLLHKKAVKYVCAAGQANALKAMMESGFLDEEENAFARRAHNHKTATKPKNADPLTYKWATAFEALLGYHRSAGREERLQEIMKEAVRITEERRGQDA